MKETRYKIKSYQITSEGITTGFMLDKEWRDSVHDFLIEEWVEESVSRLLNDIPRPLNDEEEE